MKALRGQDRPQVMMPFRVAVTGQPQTPAIDAIAAALRKDVVLHGCAASGCRLQSRG